MATFTKKIIAPGLYVTTDDQGKKTRHYVGKSRIKSWVDNFAKMTQTGLRIPAPWRHDPKAQPFRVVGDEQDVNAFQNAGYWKELWQDEKDGSLYGKVTVPRRQDASRVGRTVTEVSPLVKQAWADGETDYSDVITHIAFVTHPVVKGQENFTKEEKKDLAASIVLSSEQLLIGGELALSDATNSIQTSGGAPMNDIGPDVTSASGASVADAINILRALGLGLPRDTTEANFLERVIVAAVALKTAEQHEMNPQGAGQNTQIQQQPSPVAMSQEESIMNESLKLSAEDQAGINWAKKTATKSYLARIESLVNTGRVTKDFAVKRLIPSLNQAEIAFSSEGSPVCGSLDMTLEALEANGPGTPLTQSLTKGLTESQQSTKQTGDTQFSLSLDDQGIVVQDVPDNSWEDPDSEDVSEERSEEIMRQMAKNTGYSWLAAS